MPTEQKHTPGPWVIALDQSRIEDYVCREICAVTLCNQITHIYSDAPYDDCRKDRLAAGEANARLIASAPDLLAALKLVRDSVGKEIDDLTAGAAMKVVNDAIARTEGRKD